MDNPGLLHELPDIAALLSEPAGDRGQSAAADRTLAGLDAMTDLALNHRLAQGTHSYREDFVYSGVVGGLDSTDLQKGQKAICQLQDLLSGANCFGLRRSLAPLVAQLHHLLQLSLKGLADRSAALSQAGPVDRSVLVAVPVIKQLWLQVQKFRAELGAGARAFSDGVEVADQVRPAQLALLGGQVVACREAIAHQNPAKGAAQQLDGGGYGSARPWMNAAGRQL